MLKSITSINVDMGHWFTRISENRCGLLKSREESCYCILRILEDDAGPLINLILELFSNRKRYDDPESPRIHRTSWRRGEARRRPVFRRRAPCVRAAIALGATRRGFRPVVGQARDREVPGRLR